MSPEQSPEQAALRERQNRLSRSVSNRAMAGWNIVDRNDQECYAVLMLPGTKVNHVLHLILSVLTCGIWLPLWIFMMLRNKQEQRVRITVDAQGSLIEEPINLK